MSTTQTRTPPMTMFDDVNDWPHAHMCTTPAPLRTISTRHVQHSSPYDDGDHYYTPSYRGSYSPPQVCNITQHD